MKTPPFEIIGTQPRSRCTFSHAFSLGFEVKDSTSSEAEDVTADMMERALLSKIAELKANGMLVKAVGSAFDTVTVEPDRKFEAHTLKPTNGLVFAIPVEPEDTLQEIRDALIGRIEKSFRDPYADAIDGLDDDFLLDATETFFEAQKDYDSNGRWMQPGEDYNTIYFVI